MRAGRDHDRGGRGAGPGQSLAALLAKDLDRVMDDYDDGSVLRTEHGVAQGRTRFGPAWGS